MEELPHLQGGHLGKKPYSMMFRFCTNEGLKTMWDGHLTNISIEILVQFLNMYGFFGLLSDLRGVLIDYAKVVDGGQGVVVIFTMFKYGSSV